MIVDTGGLNLLTPAAVARLGLASEGKVAVSGVGTDHVDAGFARGHVLELGGVRLADPAFYVLDFGSLNDVEGEPFDGLVGFELFHRMVVRIDYAARTLVLAKPNTPPPDHAIAVPFEMRERTPIVAGEIDGIPARLTIDTGARNALSITSPFVRAHDLEGRYKPAFETVTGWGVGGGVRAKPVRIAHVKLGSATVDAVAAELFTGDKGSLADPDSSGNVGSGLLKRFVVTFDYEHHVIYLVPSTTPVHDIYDRSGMFVVAAGDALNVVAVTPRGPAEKAGIHVDDRITAIDGQPISSKHVAAWREILSAGEIGSKHVVDLAPGAKRTLVLAELLP